MSYFINKLKGMLVPLKKTKEEEIGQDESFHKNIYSIRIDDITYWLPKVVSIDTRYSEVSCFIKIACELMGLEKITQEEAVHRLKEIHEKELKETEENKDGTE